MKDFNATLLREKFVIRDPTPVSDQPPVVALSNRVAVSVAIEGGEPEEYIVRTQNMHSCVRMAARIVHAIDFEGRLTARRKPFDWAEAWESTNEAFEKKYNPSKWGVIYHKGKVVFSQGDHHPFLDIIESCDFKSTEDYDRSIALAEDAFRKAGKVVKIEHDANVALVVNVGAAQARCGIILRGPDRTTTFNFTAKPGKSREMKVSPCLTVSAAFLEGVQLAFNVGMGKEKIRFGLVDRWSDEGKRIDAAEKRLARLRSAIKQFEQMFDVHYRPDVPDFFKLAEDAADIARNIFGSQIEQKIASGEIDEKEWVR